MHHPRTTSPQLKLNAVLRAATLQIILANSFHYALSCLKGAEHHYKNQLHSNIRHFIQ
jgi:hypothetical protein